MQTSIWVVSVEGAAARRAAFEAAAASASVQWHFFDAHTGLRGALVYDEAATMRTRQRPLRSGELGCYSSHYALWKWLVDSDVEQMVVLEDDVIVDWPFIEQLIQLDFAQLGIRYLRLFAKVPAPWRMVCSPFFDRYRHLIRFTGLPLGTQGYVITKSAARALMLHGESVSMPVDVLMDAVWRHGVPNLAIYPFPLFERHQPSSIGEERFVSQSGSTFDRLSAKIRRRLRVWQLRFGPDSHEVRRLRGSLRGASGRQS